MNDDSSNSNSDASVPRGMKPIDIPVPIFPQRTASVPNIGVSHEQKSVPNANNRLFQTFQTKADWRLFLTVEERQLIRKKISTAYESRTQTYDELLQTCAAIEEELVFVSAPSRLDYFKTGMQFEKRVAEKRKHLTEGPVSGHSASGSSGGSVFSPGKPPAMQAISERGTDKDNSREDRDSVSNDSLSASSDDESDPSSATGSGPSKRQRASSK